jgi:hypothetical protein
MRPRPAVRAGLDAHPGDVRNERTVADLERL